MAVLDIQPDFAGCAGLVSPLVHPFLLNIAMV
jgi:hypothetical protein